MIAGRERRGGWGRRRGGPTKNGRAAGRAAARVHRRGRRRGRGGQRQEPIAGEGAGEGERRMGGEAVAMDGDWDFDSSPAQMGVVRGMGLGLNRMRLAGPRELEPVSVSGNVATC